jgi:uncharacterized protein
MEWRVSYEMVGQPHEDRLASWLEGRGSVLIGYSGGVDSAYLSAVSLATLGPDSVLAVIGRSPSYPDAQWSNARAVAAQIGLPVREIETNELADPRYAANPSNRCYFCKTELWSKLVPLAKELRLSTVVDGTNADDLTGHRPGKAAAKEWGVESPLAELGFTKSAIREFSQRRGLPTWDQPSSPCLSSRLPTGIAVTPLRLAKVEAAERAARAVGVRGDLRVRYHGDTARVEVSTDEIARWTTGDDRRALAEAVAGAGFTRVELDLRGFRSGKASQPADEGSLELLHG